MPDRIELSAGPVVKAVASAPALDDPIGSIALRHGGGRGTSLYIKEATGTSGWSTIATSGTVPTGVGSVWGSLSALPTTATWTANLLSLMTVYVPVSCTVTGLQVPNGGTAAGNLLAAIWNADGTSLLAASASTAQAGTFVTQLVPFAATAALTPGAYLIGVIPSDGTATFVQFNGFNPAASAAQGGFTVPATVTPPTSTARIYAIAAATY